MPGLNRPLRLRELDDLARVLVVAPGVARAASVAVAVRIGSGWALRTGAAGTLGEDRSADSDTVFDLASLSKSFTAVTAARLSVRGACRFDTRLDELVPETRGSESGASSLELLLAHRAGLEAHLELFAPLRARRAVNRARLLRTAAASRRPECAGPAGRDGHPPLYSDLGYLLAGALLENAGRLPLDELVFREVSEPLELELGSARKWLTSTEAFSARVAPSEVVSWRGGRVQGVVHDENAWALSGHAASGHAGLFGTARSVARFGAELLDALAGRTSFLSPDALTTLTGSRKGGTLRAGFDGKSATASSAGALAGPRTFGHLGFTGTSFWCDPDADAVVVLLSNRTYPSRANTRIRAVRPVVHDELFAWAHAQGSGA